MAMEFAPDLDQRVSKGKFAVAAVTLDDYLPMRSTEMKNRTSTDGIKSLRLITAVKTPYLPDGRFDLEAYASLLNTPINGGAEGVIVGGTTGEGHLMSWDEHIMLIGHTVNCFGANIKVIGNTGSNSTREAVEQGFAVGMHAALHVNPYYGKTSTEGLISHFKEVLPMGPTIIYNVPSRTSQDIPPPVIEALSCYSNMAGVKEYVGHERVKCYTDKGITIWSGNDDECHDSGWKYGATGVISVASNLVPGLMHSLMFEGENETLNEKLLPLEKRVEFVRIVEAIGREKFVGQKEARVLDDDDFVLISRPSNPEGLQSIERLGKCISAGHVAIQSLEVEETELACYLRSGGLAPVTSGGNNFPKRTTGGKGTNIPLRRRRLFTLSFKESGQASAVVIDIGEAQWIVDSGAAASLTGDSSLLEGLHTIEVMYFRVANGQIVSSNTCGRASGLVNLSGIRYSPGCHQNIISARHLINLGCVVTFDGEGCSIRKNGVLIGKAPPATEPEGLFYLDYLRDAQLGSICWACPHPTVQGN